MITQRMIEDLAYEIWKNITEEFDWVHPVSGNLTSTSYIEPTEKGVRIVIPAERYDKDLWEMEGVIVYTGEGSYAQKVDDVGGWARTRRHTNYVMRHIPHSIQKWLRENDLKGDIRIE